MNVYDNNEINYNDGIVDMLAKVPMDSLLTQNYRYEGIIYDPYFDLEEDLNGVLRKYKSAGMIIAGLLFGYPIEATICEIEKFQNKWFL